MRMTANKQKGIALVLVLWMLALLTIMATGYSRMMRTETMLTANLVRSAQANALAEAGINQAIIELFKPVPEKTWKADGTNYEYLFNDQVINIQIHAEIGKIDLNTAHTELLYNLLKSANETEDDTLSLLQAILDWRDKDNLVRKHGAEDTDYKNIGLEYGAKDGSFNSIDELLLVKGFTSAFYRKISPALTIYSHSAGIDPQTASRQVLLAIPNISEDIIDNYVEQRNENDEVYQSTSLNGVNSKYLSNGRGTVFQITSTAKINNTYARVNAVISLNKSTQKPFSILAWQISPPSIEPKQEDAGKS